MKKGEEGATKEVDILSKIIELNLLTQDEQQMIQIVKRHHFENGIIARQQQHNIQSIAQNLQNVQILCHGDPAYEQELTQKLNEVNAELQHIRERIVPKEELLAKLRQIQTNIETLTSQQQQEEMVLHRIQSRTDAYLEELRKRKTEVEKLNESMKFKEEVHRHLKKNLGSRKQMITRLKATMEELTKKLSHDSQDLKLEQQRKQQHIDRLKMTSIRMKQTLDEAKARLENEKVRLDEQIKDWRERTRSATQRKNDILETLQKGEMETRLLQTQMQRHQQKHGFIAKRAEEVATELKTTINDIEDSHNKINEYKSVPETHLAAVRQLRAENENLRSETEHFKQDEKEAIEQVNKLKAEFKELQEMDGKGRRQKMEQQQKVLRDSLQKIDAAVLAAESSYTCFECLKAVKVPMTFVPCGHSVCRHHNSHSDDNLICPECGQQCDTVFQNTSIPELLSKLQFLHSIISTAVEN